ncbi:Mago binding-domain-containing protein [Hypomontagnella monticulosa]|nr:Mago binding-domain-containing protein [Hypomontagnella monticulosa]
MPSEPSTSGIVTDEQSGERHIPESQRADGTTRKAIKIRPGYRPPEDVEIYKNRTAETFRNRGKGGVVGAEGLKEQKQETTASAASNKNAKRREARKKAKSTNQSQDAADNAPDDASANKTEEVDPEVEKEKKARNLKKKLKQAKELKSKKEGGESLLPEQIAKVIKINELVRELEALGFDADGEPKSNTASASASKSDDIPETAKEG